MTTTIVHDHTLSTGVRIRWAECGCGTQSRTFFDLADANEWERRHAAYHRAEELLASR